MPRDFDLGPEMILIKSCRKNDSISEYALKMVGLLLQLMKDTS